jgi:hypothetical protein
MENYDLKIKSSLMKKKLLILTIAIIICTNLFAQWQHLKEPSGGMAGFVFSGNNVYATSFGGGVYLSTDNGSNWTPINTGLTNLNISAFAANGSNIYAGTWGSGVFLSTNNGASWTAVNNGLTSLYINSLLIKDSNVFAATGPGGLYLSINNGSSWASVNNGITSVGVNSLAVNGTDIIAGTSGGVYLSNNNGSSWALLGLSGLNIKCFAINGANIFAGTNNGIYLSTNNGSSWSLLNNSLAPTSLALNGNNIFAGGGQGIYLSTNNGITWTLMNNGIPTYGTGTFVAANGNYIYAGKNGMGGIYAGGIFLSTDNGTTWNLSNHGYTDVYISALGTFGSTLIASVQDEGILMTDNGGETCFARNNGIPIHYNKKLLASDGTNIYAVQTVYNHSNIFFSPDSGNSWTDITNGMSDSGRVINSITTQGTNVLLGIQGSDSVQSTLIRTGGIFKSSNHGANWSCINNGFISSKDSDVFSIAVVGNNIFVGTAGGVLLSFDSGNNWTEMNNGLGSTPNVTKIAGNGNIILSLNNYSLYRSIDNGANWVIDTNSHSNTFYVGSNFILGGTYQGGVNLSIDSGSSWHEWNDGLQPCWGTASFVVIGDTVFAATQTQGIWKRSLSDMIPVISNNKNLFANVYPSLFDKSLTIVENDGVPSRIILYDILSKKLLDQKFTNSITLNTAQLSNGVYLYQVINDNGEIASGKVIKK